MDINKLCVHCMNETGGTKGTPCPKCGRILGQMGEVTHQLKPYTILQGKYLVGDVLGEGGFGITYIGFDLNLEMKVAIKEFYPNGYAVRESANTSRLTVYAGQNAEAVYKWRESFLKEARSLGKCSHLSGVVGVRDFFQENDTAYIVLEYLEGMTLKSYAKSLGGRIGARSLLPALEPVMAALGEVHRQGLIHRDISPDNIMLLPGGQMKLLDFGAARDYTAGDEKSLSVMLKPGYAPEEQYRSKGKQGPWSDIYAFAGTIYKCLTGVTPPEAMERMRMDELRRPNELGAGLEPGQEEALLKAMSVFAEGRYQTMEEFRSALYAKGAASGAAGAEQPMEGQGIGMPVGQAGVSQGQVTGGGYARPMTNQPVTGQPTGMPMPQTGMPQGTYASQPAQGGFSQSGQTSGQAPGQNKPGLQELIKKLTGEHRNILIGAAAGLAAALIVVLAVRMPGGDKSGDSAVLASGNGEATQEESGAEAPEASESASQPDTGSEESGTEASAEPNAESDTGPEGSVLSANIPVVEDERVWKQAYLDYLFSGSSDLFNRVDQYKYDFIYLNDDEVPELFVRGLDNAEGDHLLYYGDGKIVHEYIAFGGQSYIEREGLFLNESGRMGYYPSTVYAFNGESLEGVLGIGFDYNDESGYPVEDEAGNMVLQHLYVNGEETDYTEEEGVNMLREAFDSRRSKSLSVWGEGIDFETVKLFLSSQGDWNTFAANVVQDDTAIHRYELVVADVSWSQAFQECIQRGGYLARINTYEEFIAITNQIRNEDLKRISFWVGSSCPEGSIEYHWITEDGRAVPGCINTMEEFASCWLDNEPSFYGSDENGDRVLENCIHLIYRSAEDGFFWNDAPDDILSAASFYSGKIGYICEYED